jgi:hypothetical protein
MFQLQEAVMYVHIQRLALSGPPFNKQEQRKIAENATPRAVFLRRNPV